MAALAKELHHYHQAHPHYPPSRPPQPKRRRRQRPPYMHTPSGPGDIQPGTWLWVTPGGLHPAWGDIHRLAMLLRLDGRYCEVGLDDTTVHRVKPDLLILERTPVVNAARAAGVKSLVCSSRPLPRSLLPQWQWLRWTLAEHIEHLQRDVAALAQSVQERLFAL
ncbi:hypothetical protein ACFXKR_32260 [Streptomyces violascens]|uniref:hypothetical protein n=1 Tax=Streptomyces violascens TaxID=67381 RepID=UPI003674B5A5